MDVAANQSLPSLSSRAAAQLLRDGTLSAEAYAEALLDVCDTNNSLNAFISLDAERVRRAAREADIRHKVAGPDRPLHGVPLAIKDVFDVAGVPTTAGTPALRDNVPTMTAPLVQKLFDAGALMLGKTNMHELAFGITNSNTHTGAVTNPYDRSKSPGGSSGGTAAAIAARMTPAGLGSDTSGSIRIPAAHCGVIGFRPSIGRYSAGGMVPMSPTRDVPGLMARSTDDIALIDEVLTGTSDLPPVDLCGARIGLPGTYFSAEQDSQIAAAMEAELDRLAALGVVLVTADPPDFTAARAESAGPILAWEMPRAIARYLEEAGLPLTFADLVAAVASPYVKSELDDLLTESPDLEDRYQRAVADVLPRHRAAYTAYLRSNDLQAIVFPTTPLPPPPLDANDIVTREGETVSVWLNLRNSVPATLLGAPAISLPMAMTADGLPVGLELDGWPGRDRDLLSLAHAWERSKASLPAPRL